jgi:hypothetical protein
LGHIPSTSSNSGEILNQISNDLTDEEDTVFDVMDSDEQDLTSAHHMLMAEGVIDLTMDY